MAQQGLGWNVGMKSLYETFNKEKHSSVCVRVALVTGMCPCQGAGAQAGIPHKPGKDQTSCSMELQPPSSVTSPEQISQELWSASAMFCALSEGSHWSQRELLACARDGRGAGEQSIPEWGAQSQREKELEALNGDKF